MSEVPKPARGTFVAAKGDRLAAGTPRPSVSRITTSYMPPRQPGFAACLSLLPTLSLSLHSLLLVAACGQVSLFPFLPFLFFPPSIFIPFILSQLQASLLFAPTTPYSRVAIRNPYILGTLPPAWCLAIYSFGNFGRDLRDERVGEAKHQKRRDKIQTSRCISQ